MRMRSWLWGWCLRRKQRVGEWKMKPYISKKYFVQEQADKWVRSRKRSPLPFIFVVPPSKDRSDPDPWFLILNSWSLIFHFVFVFESFAQQGQVRYCCTFVIWTKIYISIIWILSGADGLTWCEKCGRKLKKSKPTILYNRSLTVSQSQYCIYNLKEKKFFFRSFWSASTETTNLLDIPKSLNLLKLKSHICYKSIQYPWTSLWENCTNIGSLSVVEPYMISPNPQDKVMGHSQYNAVHKYLMKIILVVLIKSQSIYISILYKFIW